MPSQSYLLIRQAIAEKKQIFADYQGYPRQMCPHVIGTTAGKEQALFYQFGGLSSKGAVTHNSENNWRCMPISGLTNIRIQEGPWYTAENHSRQQTCVQQIDLEVVFK